MRRALAAGFVLFLAAYTAVAGGQQAFRSGVDLVTFGVTVVDRKGELVRDLTQDDFEVIEDGKSQELLGPAIDSTDETEES